LSNRRSHEEDEGGRVRVIGFDPGLTRTGYAIVERHGSQLVAVAHGVVATPAGGAVAARLAVLRREVDGLLAAHAPDVAAVEQLFFNSNVKTAMAVGQASGVVLCCAADAGLEVSTYTPTDVKLSVVGYCGASKQQVGAMVASLLGMGSPPRPADAADACALAICHLNRSGLQMAIRRAMA
jgi:crossover junction endodeoxyribonuclease RuvC